MYYAVTNPNWEKDEWEDCFYEYFMALSCESRVFCLAIFSKKKHAKEFCNKIKNKKRGKVIKVDIIKRSKKFDKI